MCGAGMMARVTGQCPEDLKELTWYKLSSKHLRFSREQEGSSKLRLGSAHRATLMPWGRQKRGRRWSHFTSGQSSLKEAMCRPQFYADSAAAR